MKIFTRICLALLLLSAGLVCSRAQNQPILSVSVTRIDANGIVFSPPDEAYGPYGVPNAISIYALAVGSFPAAGFNYLFYVNGQSLGKPAVTPGAASPAVLGWTPPAPGAYSIYVTASDGSNSATSLPVRFFAVGSVVNSPLPNTLVPVGSTIVIKADATPQQGFIQRIDFYDGATLIGTDTTYPYSLIYTPSGPAGSVHQFQVIATDNNGSQSSLTSPTVAVNMVAPIGAPPVVNVSSPLNGALLPIPNYAAGAANGIKLDITANASAGQVTKVETYIDGILVATSTAFPYSYNWQPTIVGFYNITALAYDDKNNVGASATNRVHIGAPPTVSVTAPAQSSTVSAGSPTVVSASASDADGTISSVQFFADGALIGTASSAPYAITYSPVVKNDGSLTLLTAVATDNDRLTTTSSAVGVLVNSGSGGGGGVVGQPPVVAVSSPLAGATFPVNAPVTLQANASDPDGNIVSVQFLVNNIAVFTDTVFPYTTNWTPTALGPYNIVAKATDNAGNTVLSAPVTLTVVANSQGTPTIAITSPAPNVGGVVNSPIVISANAGDPDGSVTLVEFYVNGLLQGSRTTTPYAAVWTPATPGVYTLTAAVTDDAGNRVMSDPVTETISGGIGSSPYGVLSISYPNVDSSSTVLPTALVPVSVSLGSKLVVSAAGVDADGAIAKVDFYANGIQIGSIANPPYDFVWQLNTLATVTLGAVFTDNAGNVFNAVPVIISPTPSTGAASATVTLNSPNDGATYNAGSQIIFNATTNLGTVNPPKVDFYINGSQFQTVTAPPYQYTIGLSQPGTYYVQAVARTGTIVTTSNISRITVLANQPPTVALSSPSSGGTYKFGSTITINATAADPDGNIQSVQFFVNGSALSTDSSAPYSATFNPAAEGVYSISAVATDNAGATTSSAPVTILVYSAVSTNTDAVYTGTYGFGSEAGNFAAVVTGGKYATFIAHSTAGTPRSFYYTGLPVNASGGFSQTDAAGKKLLAVAAADGNSLSGTLDGGRLVLIGLNPGVFAQNTYNGAGLYLGSIGSRSTSVLTAIVGADRSIMLYVSDGSFTDSADGLIDSTTGAFTATTIGGNKFAGKVDETTHFVSGTLSGSSGGTFTAALASGGLFSDGILRGLSTRAFVGTGNNLLIAGFVVDGTKSKRVLVRGIGPSLAGVSNLLADPQLKLFSGPTLVAANDNWGNDPAIAAASAAVGVGALPASSLDAVIYTTLSPGAYTAQVNGANGGTGNALVEIYDADTMLPFSAQRIGAISTRGFVGTPGNELITGFIITGSAPKKVLIQAVGPGIAGSVGGTLTDPAVQLVSMAGGQVVRDNDNWETGNDASLVTDAITRSAATPLASGSKDAAILVSLPPGAYTAVVRGTGGATGIALINVFEVP